MLGVRVVLTSSLCDREPCAGSARCEHATLALRVSAFGSEQLPGPDRAFDVIEQAIAQNRPLRPDSHDGFGMARGQSALQLFVSNCGEPIWKHRRFPALAARLGLAQYWVESNKWPDCAAEVDYDFKSLCVAAVAA